MNSWKFLKFWGSHVWTDVQSFLINDETYLPRTQHVFKALELTPHDKVKCVILGQDPYPTPGHAMGLAFSVPPHVHPLPPSLRNIFREYSTDLGYPPPRFGDLTPWAKEGVLLLNTILTVEAHQSLSHAGIGWEKLTHEMVKALDTNRSEQDRVVFILWGSRAQEYKGAIKNSHVLTAPHPSPLSAHTGFFGSKPFSKVNAFLGKGNEINWRLP